MKNQKELCFQHKQNQIYFSILSRFMPDMMPKQLYFMFNASQMSHYKLLGYFSMAFQKRICYYLKKTQLYGESKETIPHLEKECTL